MRPTLLNLYVERITPDFLSQFEMKNIHQVPRLEKIVLNVGAGEAVKDQKIIASIQEDLKMIAGQQPIITKAKNSIAGFKLREGMPIGVKATLRGKRMYEFMERLTRIILPRVRDFKGVSPKSFDGKGNYTFGIKEQIVFPEIDFDNITKICGLNISFSTTAQNDTHGKFLLEKLGMPFRNS